MPSDPALAALAKLREGMTAGPYSIAETENGYDLLAGSGGIIATFRFRSPARYVEAVLNEIERRVVAMKGDFR